MGRRGPPKKPTGVKLAQGETRPSRVNFLEPAPRRAAACTGRRRVFFDDWVDTPIYWRPDLHAGATLPGPAVVEEFGSTVPVHPGFAARVDGYGNVVVTRIGEERLAPEVDA